MEDQLRFCFGQKKKVCLKAHAPVCEIGRFGQKLMREFFISIFLNEILPVVRGSSTQNSHDTQKFKMVLSVQICK